MHRMNLRSVPFGENECFKFNLSQKRWSYLANVPLGRLMSTLVAVNNRYVFQIGGFEDYDYSVYCLDTEKEVSEWIDLTFVDPWAESNDDTSANTTVIMNG